MASSSIGVVMEGMWHKIWILKCPNRVKHFIWRFINNPLALRTNLKRTDIDVDMRCAICQWLDEDGAHLFFKCKWAKKLWRELGLEDIRVQLSVLFVGPHDHRLR